MKVKDGIIHDDKRAGTSHTVTRVTELGISLKAMSKRLVLAENTCLSSALGKEDQITYLHNSVREVRRLDGSLLVTRRIDKLLVATRRMKKMMVVTRRIKKLLFEMR